MSTATEAFQVSLASANAYEEQFVPALFADWARHLVDAAGVTTGQRVLDVACGTGVVAREAFGRTGPTGRVVGLDINEAMLTVARQLQPEIEWRHGDAAALPFGKREFDVVLCQAGLMFFPDRVKTLREMGRVVAADGIVALQVPGRLDGSPGYACFAEVVARHAGRDGVELMASYWSTGDTELLEALIEEAGLRVAGIDRRQSTTRVASIDDFVAAEIGATPLADSINEADYKNLLADARTALSPFQTADGATEIPIEAVVVTARPQG